MTSFTSIFDISILPITDLISDHYALSFSINNTYRSSSLITIYSRDIKHIPLNLIELYLICFSKYKILDFSLFNNYLLYLLNKYAPIKIKQIITKPYKWFNNERLTKCSRIFRKNRNYKHFKQLLNS